MTPDPLQSLNQIEKWIIEHGGGAVQKSHLVYLNSVVRTLGDQSTKLKAIVAELESELNVARHTSQQLHAQNKKLYAALADATKEPAVTVGRKK